MGTPGLQGLGQAWLGSARLGSPRRCGAGVSLCSLAAGRGRSGEAKREAGGRPGVGLGRTSPEGVGWIFVLFCCCCYHYYFFSFFVEKSGEGGRVLPCEGSTPEPPLLSAPPLSPGALRGSPPTPHCLSLVRRTDSPPLSLSLQHVEDPGINIPDQTVIKKGELLPRAWWQSLGAAGQGLRGRAG